MQGVILPLFSEDPESPKVSVYSLRGASSSSRNKVTCLLPTEEEAQVGEVASLRAHSPCCDSCVCLPAVQASLHATNLLTASSFSLSGDYSFELWVFFLFLINWAICIEGNKLLT